jgi:hypothetical protein
MTDLDGFERRLLHALTDLDARRAVNPPADTANRTRPPVARRRLVLVAVTTILVVGTTALAAASGLFPTAPAEVRRIFAGLSGDRDVDADRAVRIGVIDDHEAYAAPTEDGGFCLYFAPNPRSGPQGITASPAWPTPTRCCSPCCLALTGSSSSAGPEQPGPRTS